MSDLSVSSMSNSICASDDKVNAPPSSLKVFNADDIHPRSFNPSSDVNYKRVPAKSFNTFFETYKANDNSKLKMNFVDLVVSTVDNQYLLLRSDAEFKFNGHLFTNLTFRSLKHNGMNLKDCTLVCEGRSLHWNDVAVTNANFGGVKIYGKGGGGSSVFLSFSLRDVNLRKAEINDVEFYAGDEGHLREVVMRDAKLNNVAFLGQQSTKYNVSDTDFTGAVLTNPRLGHVVFSKDVNISQSKWCGLKIVGPVDGAGIICENYQKNDITWHPAMFQNSESLRCALCPEKGAFFIFMMQSMKEKNSRIVLDSVNQMVRLITQSSPVFKACLEDKSLRRALIEELRDPLYSACAELQYFRGKLLIHHYQSEPLRPDDLEHKDLMSLLETLPVDKRLRLQVVINQLAASKQVSFNSLIRSEHFPELIACAERNSTKFPYLFINEKRSEIICLSERDFRQLLASDAAPQQPQLIRYHRGTAREAEMVSATPEAIANIRKVIPLLNTSWRCAEYPSMPVIRFLFSAHDGLSAGETIVLNKIVEHIHSLLLQRTVRKKNLVQHTKLLRKVFSPFSKDAYQTRCEELIERVCKQFANHPIYSSFTTEQQQSVVVVALIKLFVELSTEKYLGADKELAVGLLEPIKSLFIYACEKFPSLFSADEQQEWRLALITEGLIIERDAQKLLSRINNYQFPFLGEKETRNILNDLYPLVAFHDD